ncbi:MAG: hypothetical protein AAF658_16240 [Myxococcota bacterium]
MRIMTTGAAVLALLMIGPSAEAQEGDPLAELAALGDAMAETGPEGGGSIRAKKTADLGRTKRTKDKRNIEAQVEEVNNARFPLVAIKLKVRKAAKEGSGRDFARNDRLVVIPVMKFDGKSADLSDEATLLNAGAFYLQKGDKVFVRVGEKRGNTWSAEYIERK